MPGPGSTSSAKKATLIRQGQTETGKFGDGTMMKGAVPKPRDLKPKG